MKSRLAVAQILLIFAFSAGCVDQQTIDQEPVNQVMETEVEDAPAEDGSEPAFEPEGQDAPDNETAADGENAPEDEIAPENETTSGRWIADGIVSEGEYNQSLVLPGGRYKVHWKNDAEDLYMALVGQAQGFVAIGFEPSRRMMDADMVMGWVADGEPTVLDLYATAPVGLHPPDEDLGGTDDLLESGGEEVDDTTVIEFKRKMDTGDEWDKAFTQGQTVRFIWSMSTTDEFGRKHNVAKGSSQLTLE